MDKKTYRILISLIVVSVILVFFNIGGEISLKINGILEVFGGVGQLVLIGVVGYMISKEAKKKES